MNFDAAKSEGKWHLQEMKYCKNCHLHVVPLQSSQRMGRNLSLLKHPFLVHTIQLSIPKTYKDKLW